MKRIQTGADKLVDLIQNTKRIRLEDAAKALGVTTDLVQDWAEFLEKEKLISIDYSFSKVFLTQRQFSSKEIKQSAKEIVSEKDAFVRKIENALSSLDADALSFNEIKKQFNNIQESVKEEVQIVEKELKNLEEFNKLKNSIGKNVKNQQEKYQEEIDKIYQGLKFKEDEFNKLYVKILKEKEGILQKEELLNSLKENHSKLIDSFDSLKDEISKNKKLIESEEKELNKKAKIFHNLSVEVERFSKDMLNFKDNKIKEIHESLDKDSKHLFDEQKDLLKGISVNVAKLEKYDGFDKKIKDSFKGVFERTFNISKKIDEIEVEKKELRANLLALDSKAKAISLMKNNKDLQKQVDEINVEIKKQEELKKKLYGKIGALLDYLKN